MDSSATSSALHAPDRSLVRGTLVRAIRARITPARALAGIVALSAIARSVVGLARATPTYFPDEYLYSALSRSIAETGRPLVRGASGHTPALLEPFLTAPAWLIGNTEVAYHVAQAISATAMSLAAIPVYLVCCRLGLRRATALAAAAAAVSLPVLMYATTLIAEPFAYPLALGAVAAGTIALGSGSRRAQVAFFIFAAAAAAARVQLLVIPVAYLVAALVVALRTRSLRRIAREQAFLFAALTLPLLTLVLLRGRLLGIYSQAGGTASHDPGAVARAVGGNALLLLYSAGWVIVPGAVLGLVATIVRPRSRLELSFGALAVSMGGAVILQASLWGDTDRTQERYFMYAIPLVAVLFGITADRGWPWRRAYGLLVAGTVLVAALIPLSGYAESTMKTHSPTLYGVFTIEEHLGTATGALAVALVATTLSVVALALPRLTSQRGGPVGLALACVACLALAVAAANLDLRDSTLARQSSLPDDRAWVDHAHVGHVTFLRGDANRGDTFEQLFWNRSIKRVLLLPAALPLDVTSTTHVTISADGTLRAEGQPITGALLADETRAAMQFRASRVLGSSPANVLVLPSGPAQLESYANGFYHDGWLGRTGGIHLWPSRAGGAVRGILSFRLHGPTWLVGAVKIRIVRDGGAPLTFHVAPKKTITVRLAVCGRGLWNAGFVADRVVRFGDRAVSVAATSPRWRATPGACPAR